MSLEGLKWAKTVRGVDAFGKALLWSLGDRHDAGNDTAVCDVRRLAEEACMELAMAEVYLGTLEKYGFIEAQGQAPTYGPARLQRRFFLHIDRTEPRR